MKSDEGTESHSMESHSVDEFRKREKEIRKYFKDKQNNDFTTKQPGKRKLSSTSKFDPTEILNLRNIDYNSFSNRSKIKVLKLQQNVGSLITIDDPYKINPRSRIYHIDTDEADGLLIIKDALTVEAQYSWAQLCLEKYSQSAHTNLTNLDNIKCKSENDYSNLWSDTVKDQDENFERVKPLRWACLGYHYDWTARMYQEDLKSPFPSELAHFCKLLANHVQLDILAEAAIVNYYPHGSCMSGHIDDAEHTLDEPIVSISIGCPAIFLIGGPKKDIIPIPILIESGDVVIMSGRSRSAYHGVAVVLEHHEVAHILDCYPRLNDNSNKNNVTDVNSSINSGHTAEDTTVAQKSTMTEETPLLTDDDTAASTVSPSLFPSPPLIANKQSWDPISNYLKKFRLNINVRRVRGPSEDSWTPKCGSGAMSMMAMP